MRNMKGASYDYTILYLEMIYAQTRLTMAGNSSAKSGEVMKRIRADLISADRCICEHFDENLFRTSNEWEDEDPDLGD